MVLFLMAKVVKDLYWFTNKSSSYKIYTFRKRQSKAKKGVTVSNTPISLKKYNPITRKHELFELKKAKK